MPELPSLEFSSDAEIAVYVVHHGSTAEEYEILFDFELFVAENQKGFLVRPKLQVWSGRSDFERHIFARRLRQEFMTQFEIVRREIAQPEKRSFWKLPSFSVWDIGGTVFMLGGSLVSTIALMLATSAGRAAIDEVSALLSDSVVGRTFQRKSSRVALEEKIREKQTIIDEGLSRMEIRIHRDLWVHAWRGQAPGSLVGVDFSAWPLPDFIKRYLERQK